LERRDGNGLERRSGKVNEGRKGKENWGEGRQRVKEKRVNRD
jgi:hypothetical protein